MNKIIAGLFAAALVGSAAIADTGAAPAPTSKDLMKQVEEGPYVNTQHHNVKLSGYVDAGYTYNFSSTPGLNRFGNGTQGDRTARGDFNINAVKLALEKPLTDANELQAGFRVDTMLGEDAAVFGGNAGASDSLYVQQAYVQFRTPVGNGWDFKVGKFVTPLGYEVQERPANLNITYGNLFQNAQPLWHVGVLTSYKFNDMVDAKFGIVNGWNDDNQIGGQANTTGLDAGNDGAAMLLAVNLTAPGGNANLQNGVYYSFNGEDTAVGGAGTALENNGSFVVYDVWGSWVPKLGNGKDGSDPLLLGFNIDLGSYETQQNNITTAAQNSTTFWGAALYGKYKFNDIFSLAARGDYYHNDDQTHLALGTGANARPARLGNDIWSFTLTGSYDIIENMMLRTEYRLDWASDIQNSAANNSNGPSHLVSAQVVYSF